MPAEDRSSDSNSNQQHPRSVSRWEEDFPIQTDRDHYVTRREFAKFLALGSALLAAANAVIAFVGLRSTKAQAPLKLIARSSAIPKGGSALFRYPTAQDPCIIIRSPTGNLLAYSQVCTHLSCAVIHQPEQNQLFCPCHHGYFSESEGRPIAGPPTRRLPGIKLEQRGDDVYAVGIEV
ncbi:MAG TPA: Rieske 2Fe-2S domain-containing protein [Blastocatellia bacterium]|nr:Rieske 2Fe-2S domain-containing protein [Blastocatellia bacterium]